MLTYLNSHCKHSYLFIECLRTLFHDRQLDKAGDGPGCGEAVATLIEFSNADIHTDPVLHDACSLDLSKFCREVPQGNSQQVTCILTLVVQLGSEEQTSSAFK